MTTNERNEMNEQEIAEMEAYMDAQEESYRATLTPAQLRNYRLFNQEIIEQCPACHTRDAEVTHDVHPDMIGYAWSITCDTCDHVIESGGDGIEAVR